MRVLFASGIDGFCHRYAVLHWAEQLAGQGVASTVRAHTDARLAADLASHDVLVLYRVPISPWIEHLLAAARARGRAAVFAVDDRIVRAEPEEVPELRRTDAAGRALWWDGVRRYRACLLACDAFLATSAPLAVLGEAAGVPTFLHRHGLGARELALAERARATARPAGPLRIGYFSGTATHDDDLAVAAPALAAVLARRADVALVLGGAVTLDPRLASFADRVVRVPWVPWPELPARLAACDVLLAPLEWQLPFAAAKGAIKWLEAAAVGIPLIASPTDAFRDAIRDGETGLLAGDTATWATALDRLLADAGLRRRIGAAAAADVRTRFAPAAQGPALAARLAEIAARGSRVAAAPAPAVPLDADERTLARAFPGEIARAAREPDALPDGATGAVSVVSAPLGDGTVLAQDFRARQDGLARVDVHTVTYGLPLDHRVEARVRRADGSTVAREEVDPALAPDRGWLAIAWPAEPASRGRTYRLELAAAGTGPRNALSFGLAAPGDAAPPCTRDGVPEPGPLALRTFADPGVLAA